MPVHPPRWLEWAREIQALAQTSLAFCDNEYEAERLRRLMRISAEIVGSHTELTAESLAEGFLAQAGYATPKVDVRGAVVRDGKILLVRERSDGLWCLPGGWADVGDYPSGAVVREVREESGFEVVAEKVIGVFDANRGPGHLELYHAYKLVYLCRLVGGQARASNETTDVGFFSFDELPDLSLRRTNAGHLAEIQAHIHDPGRSAAFD